MRVRNKSKRGRGRHREVLNFTILHKHLCRRYIIQAPRDITHIIPSPCQSGKISRGMGKALIVRMQEHISTGHMVSWNSKTWTDSPDSFKPKLECSGAAGC